MSKELLSATEGFKRIGKAIDKARPKGNGYEAVRKAANVDGIKLQNRLFDAELCIWVLNKYRHLGVAWEPWMPDIGYANLKVPGIRARALGGEPLPDSILELKGIVRELQIENELLKEEKAKQEEIKRKRKESGKKHGWKGDPKYRE